MILPRDSVQLDLALGDCLIGGEEGEVPWGGVAPRTLTKIHMALFLRRKAQKSVSEFADPAQLELWPSNQKAPPVYGGAPLLVGLPRR